MKSEKEIRKELSKMRKHKKDSEHAYRTADNALTKKINRDAIMGLDAIISVLKWVLKK